MTDSPAPAGLLLQFGCGRSAPSGWRNFDASPVVRAQRLPVLGRLVVRGGRRFPANVEYGDVVRGLPVAASSCGLVYCSHVLEHLALEDLRAALADVYRVLVPGGRFRLVVPDLEHCARVYLADGSPEAAVRFLRGTRLGLERRDRGLGAVLREWLGNSRHLWMWDFSSLAAELERTGFAAVRRAEIGDSEDPRFQAVEESARWRSALGIECRKPA